MEITDKDFELVDNYLDETLSQEELALFRIRMQDEEFAGLLRFQQALRKELAQPSLLRRDDLSQAETFYHEYRDQQKRGIADTLHSKWWFLAVVLVCFTSLLIVLLL